jgi:hypothetical protein
MEMVAKNIGQRVLIARDIAEFWKFVETHGSSGYTICLKE